MRKATGKQAGADEAGDASGGRAEALRLTREGFLNEVRMRSDSRTEARCAKVLDALIEWSLQRGRLTHAAHPGEQHTVKFALADGRVFWEAFPRNEDGGRLTVLQRVGTHVPAEIHARVRDRLAALDPTEGGQGDKRPQVSFASLCYPPNLRELLSALEEALEAIRPAEPS